MGKLGIHKETIMSNLDYKHLIWVEEEELGKEKIEKHKNKKIKFRVPQKIHRKAIIRLRGLGKTKGDETGDLLLYIWLNKGNNISKNLWVSETYAKNGGYKKLFFEKKILEVLIPKGSHNGSVLRLKGLGKKLSFRWNAPFLNRKRGELLLNLCVYQENITPIYGSFEMLDTDEMDLESWVYLKIDELKSIGISSYGVNPISADLIADLFNERNWNSIFHALVSHLDLNQVDIKIIKSSSISLPGMCEKTILFKNNVPLNCKYKITINEQFLDNPFCIAAILSHELCHVLYSEKIEKINKYISKYSNYENKPVINNPKALEEEERTVDLLVFIFKLGEFQLRTSRDKQLTLGYFNQKNFERMQVIVSRK